ncbi:MAG: hypothetical protein ACPIOQ_79945 [Promethearchaeia archaeon]
MSAFEPPCEMVCIPLYALLMDGTVLGAVDDAYDIELFAGTAGGAPVDLTTPEPGRLQGAHTPPVPKSQTPPLPSNMHKPSPRQRGIQPEPQGPACTGIARQCLCTGDSPLPRRPAKLTI